MRLAKYPALELARRIYRWSLSSRRLVKRSSRIRASLLNLPRSNVGVRLAELDPTLDKKLAHLRQPNQELVIGDFDQDGGLLPRFGPIAGIPSIEPDQFMERTGCPVLLVDLNGRLGVRKEFKSFGRFVQEIEAMLELEARQCPVPSLMNVDWAAHKITMTFVPGGVVRELLALAGADIRDRNSTKSYSRTVDKERIRSGREHLPKVLAREDVARIAAGLAAIHASGFVLEDVKFGNIILASGSGRPIFVDLERALPTDRLPAALTKYLREIDLKKFEEHFGDVRDFGFAFQ